MTKDIREWVQKYYGDLLASTKDLKTNACCATGAPPRWLGQMLQNVNEDVLNRFYGCGYPIPEAIDGTTIVDFGCGTGRDVYLLSQLVGEKGKVIGVDMTESQLAVAKKTEAWHMDKFGFQKSNVEFHQGYIEDLRPLPIKDSSVDVIVSNCVFNLSPKKDSVLGECFRLLKDGGEVYFSDVFVDRRLPPEIANDPILYGECLGGAPYLPDFLSMARATGFFDPRIISTSPVTINSAEVEATAGAAQFSSVTLRLLKIPQLEERCEDYGQVATYLGGIPNFETVFQLDDHHQFEKDRPERVCGNTADMLALSRLGKYFTITGDKQTHFGLFPCGETLSTPAKPVAESIATGCC